MKIHQLFLTLSLIASASMYGMDQYVARIPNSRQKGDEVTLTMEGQEQTKHNNAHFKSSGFSDLNKRRSYTDDFAKLFPSNQPEESQPSAVICCLLCPCVTALFIHDKCCPTEQADTDCPTTPASDTEHDKNN